MTSLLRLSAIALSALGFVSCQSMKGSGGQSGSSPYASNYGDGHYNPYPGQSGYASSGGSAPTYQSPPTYTAPPSDPYAFNAPSSSTPSYSKPKPKSTASSSTAKKKTVASTSKSKSSGAKKSSSGGRYTVGKGDTLYGIARKKGTTVAKIKAANGLSSDMIRPGQALKIP